MTFKKRTKTISWYETFLNLDRDFLDPATSVTFDIDFETYNRLYIKWAESYVYKIAIVF